MLPMARSEPHASQISYQISSSIFAILSCIPIDRFEGYKIIWIVQFKRNLKLSMASPGTQVTHICNQLSSDVSCFRIINRQVDRQTDEQTDNIRLYIHAEKKIQTSSKSTVFGKIATKIHTQIPFCTEKNALLCLQCNWIWLQSCRQCN